MASPRGAGASRSAFSHRILTSQEAVLSHKLTGFRLQAGNRLQCLETVQHHAGGEVHQDAAEDTDVSGTSMGKHLVQLPS